MRRVLLAGVALSAATSLALRVVGELRLFDDQGAFETSRFDVAPANGRAVRRFQVRNVGTAPAEMESIFIDGDDAGVFVSSLDAGGLTVAQGDSIPFDVAFVPRGNTGHFSARLVVDSLNTFPARASIGLCATSVEDAGALMLSPECVPPPQPERPAPPPRMTQGCTSASLTSPFALLLVSWLARRRVRRRAATR